MQADYLREASALWNTALAALPESPPLLPDRRFGAPAWAADPAAAFAARAHLLNAKTLLRLADAMPGDAKTRGRLRFAVQQWLDATSPSNFLAFNPEARIRALETGGESLKRGVELLLGDLRQGRVSQTEESAFEVGRNLATTAGAVVFENELMQLIEYAPLTAEVHARPMLFVPPCINKYYILDLQPENSLIRYTVSQGHRVFVVSWRNPDASLAAKTWDDYVSEGPLAALDVVASIAGTPEANVLGFCVGGTLLASALAVRAARGEAPPASVTLLTTLLDFDDTGVLDLFVDEASVALRESTLGAAAPGGPALLDGRQLASTFNLLRPNDLVWNYVVAGYLKGDAPPPLDLLYWNGDSTNLPGPMYCWYLRNTYLENRLSQPGALAVCGEPVDLGRIEAPSYVYGSRDDHIVPWKSAYASTRLLGGASRFVLGASGHIAGVINPAARNKRSHWTADGTKALPADADAWLAAAAEHPGSWWADWSRWLEPHGGRRVPSPKRPGNRRFRAIEAAPGRYVRERV